MVLTCGLELDCGPVEAATVNKTWAEFTLPDVSFAETFRLYAPFASASV